MTKSFLAMTIGLLVAGCSMAPDYQRPEVPQGASWQVTSDAKANLGWQQQFSDPTLQRLIRTALENNRDLRLAALNVQSYEAQYRIQRAAQLPTVAVGAASTRQQTSGDLNGTGAEQISSQHSAEIGITAYELDLFGRIQSLKDQALETYLAQIETQRSTQISLVSSVATAYLTLVADQELLALSQSTLETEQQSYQLTQKKFELGAASDMELAQSRTTLESARVSSALYQRQVLQDRNALTLLLGTGMPGDLQLPGTLAEVEFAPIPVGAPSSLLQQRPDILAAEHSLKAANANIGAARAAFFPIISLTSSLGTASAELSGLFGSGSTAWAFSPSISLPIFNAGRLKNNLELTEIRRDLAVASYEKTVQQAFREVSDALSGQQWLARQRDIAQNALAVQTERARLSQLRYDHGSAAFLDVLDAQRDLLTAQQQAVQAYRALLSSQVSLYAALGGGTLTEPTPSTQPTQPTQRETP